MAKKAAKKSSSKRRAGKRQPRLKASPELVEKLQEFEHEARTHYAEEATVSDEDRRLLDRQIAVRDGLVTPPWKKRQQPQKKKDTQVRFAKELLEIMYPQGEWQSMGTVVIRHGCGPAAKAAGKPLPSRDSFARATGRRS
jgi:hypothetical protein